MSWRGIVQLIIVFYLGVMLKGDLDRGDTLWILVCVVGLFFGVLNVLFDVFGPGFDGQHVKRDGDDRSPR